MQQKPSDEYWPLEKMEEGDGHGLGLVVYTPLLEKLNSETT